MFKIICLLTLFAVLGNAQLLQASEKYYVSTVTLEYLQAYAVCRRNGLTLITERSAEEGDHINAAISAVGASSHYHWLGGLNVTEGELQPAYVWLESSEVLNYTNWQSGQPTKGYNCLMRFAVDDTPPAQWGTRSCSGVLWFVCQNL